ncbi:MAG: hypothetical protein DIU76_02235 [Bacillota bacterium]|nr:MAG: hypothetical protein DIU76_02235 [Bacillota bacterium]
MVGDGISAAMRDLAEFGWVDVPGRCLAETIAAEARRLGVDARILPLSNGWYRVETYGKAGAERAWVAVRAVVRRPGTLRARRRDAVVSGDGRRGRARDGDGDEVEEHLVIVDTGRVVHLFSFPPECLDGARAFARTVEEEGIADPQGLESLAGRMGGRRR